MSIYHQLSDMTEIHSSALSVHSERLKAIKTQFVMGYIREHASSHNLFDAFGFKKMSRMSNCYQGHSYSRHTYALDFYWLKLHEHQERELKPSPRTWDSKPISLTASGCGMAFGEYDPKTILLYAKFFSVIRVPHGAHENHRQVLAAYNFRVLDEGDLSTYYINGWKPEEYSWAKENEFWFNLTGVDLDEKHRKEEEACRQREERRQRRAEEARYALFGGRPMGGLNNRSGVGV